MPRVLQKGVLIVSFIKQFKLLKYFGSWRSRSEPRVKSASQPPKQGERPLFAGTEAVQQAASGKTMEKELLEKLITCALKLLSRRPQSEWEVKNKLGRFLARRKITEKEIYLNEVLKYLKKFKYLNDADFARWFMEQRAQFRPQSKRGLYFELKQKGVAEEIISQVLANYDEEAACQKLAQKKSSLSPKKLTSYLLRQGFPSDLVKQTVNLNQSR